MRKTSNSIINQRAPIKSNPTLKQLTLVFPDGLRGCQFHTLKKQFLTRIFNPKLNHMVSSPTHLLSFKEISYSSQYPFSL